MCVVPPLTVERRKIAWLLPPLKGHGVSVESLRRWKATTSMYFNGDSLSTWAPPAFNAQPELVCQRRTKRLASFQRAAFNPGKGNPLTLSPILFLLTYDNNHHYPDTNFFSIHMRKKLLKKDQFYSLTSGNFFHFCTPSEKLHTTTQLQTFCFLFLGKYSRLS